MFAFLNRVFLCWWRNPAEYSYNTQDDILSQDILDNIDKPSIDIYDIVNTFPDLFKNENPTKTIIINRKTSIKEHIIDLSNYLDL